MVIAIDPGNEQSAFVLIDTLNKEPLFFDKLYNDEMLMILEDRKYEKLVIEMISSYNMKVGASIFDTCVWVGRFIQKAVDRNIPFEIVYRKDVKKHFGVITRSKKKLPNADSQIRSELIKRYAKFDFKNGKGVANDQDTFYGFKADIWQAYALGVYYLEKDKD
jgi:hypothetical protein